MGKLFLQFDVFLLIFVFYLKVFNVFEDFQALLLDLVVKLVPVVFVNIKIGGVDFWNVGYVLYLLQFFCK